MSTSNIEEEDDSNKQKQILEEPSKEQEQETRTIAGPQSLDSKEFRTPEMVQSEWTSFYAKLQTDKMRHIAKIATSTRFKIRVKNAKGTYENVWKTYTPCTVNEWQELEDMRAEYQDMLREDQRIEQKIARWVRENDALQRITGGELKNLVAGTIGEDLTEKLGLTPLSLSKEERSWKRTVAKFLVKLQGKGWTIFFSSPLDEFLRSEWRDASDAVDACNHRTTWSLPS